MAWPANLWIQDGAEQSVRTRSRRRAVLRGEAATGFPDQAVLVERAPPREAALARRLLGLCHVHVLRLLEAGVDAQGGFLVSAAPAGVDLQTAAQAARAQGPLPQWWVAAVVAAAGRGLLALHRHAAGTARPFHGALDAGTIFVGWRGEVQILSCAAAARAGAPELTLAPRLAGPAADVYALGRLLHDLAPSPAGPLGALIGRTLQVDPATRPTLPALLEGLRDYLVREAPHRRTAEMGAVLLRLCPQDAVELEEEEAWEPKREGAAPGAGSEAAAGEAPEMVRTSGSAAGDEAAAISGPAGRRRLWPAAALLCASLVALLVGLALLLGRIPGG